jgi:hypothetical protein
VVDILGVTNNGPPPDNVVLLVTGQNSSNASVCGFLGRDGIARHGDIDTLVDIRERKNNRDIVKVDNSNTSVVVVVPETTHAKCIDHLGRVFKNSLVLIEVTRNELSLINNDSLLRGSVISGRDEFEVLEVIQSRSTKLGGESILKDVL